METRKALEKAKGFLESIGIYSIETLYVISKVEEVLLTTYSRKIITDKHFEIICNLCLQNWFGSDKTCGLSLETSIEESIENYFSEKEEGKYE